ncbi:hypothetical protein F5050DRAFT_1806806 [Lentinula boryana]|uniref:Uncharacterized protein n=1 Tax=Lentinula boryana TaxID=40481 RepID=A0ABQ8QG76_9AGAR|nr:hypothetical protein F5050DRAFT_1806806 [Lentinula boryana]
MLLRTVFFTLGVISAVCAAPFTSSSNLATPSLAVRAKPEPKLVDIMFTIDPSETDPPPQDVQRRIALAVFGDVSKTSSLHWSNGYTFVDTHFRWRRRSIWHATVRSGWSTDVIIPSTEVPGKAVTLVDWKSEKKKIEALSVTPLTEEALEASGLNGKGSS